MTVTKTKYYVLYEADKAEKAINTMRCALGKKNEQVAAVKFAHTILEMYGERLEIENQKERKHLDLLYTYYKIHAVRGKLQDVNSWANEMAAKVYEEYRGLGGDYIEEEMYRTGKTYEEVVTRRNTPLSFSISTRNMKAEEITLETTEGTT